MIRITGFAAAAFLVSAATASADYGAIYFSQDTGAYGYSWNYRTQEAAEDAAYNECRRHRSRPRDCVMATWFRNACGALAVGDGNGWGASWGRTIREAERKALNTCRDYNNTGCRVEVSFCSDQ
ncbi:MAG: DUF4189 domain-containing protein [Alphaproteobacteria bacterium]|nr:MAG: DUF4189 domain-containing protein [Alphaproteobacteria bacterium]